MITKKFEEIVKNGNKLEIKVALKNRLLFARDINSFDEMLEYVKRKGIDVYEKHDNKSFPSENSSQWNENLLDKEINNLIDNFSKERIDNIRKLIAKLENKTNQNDIAKLENKTNQNDNIIRPNIISTQSSGHSNSKRGFSQDNFNKNIGIGLTAIGGVVVVTSLFTSLGVKTLIGAAIAGAGIIILISENK